MLKQTQLNIADSNIANLGSDLEKKVRLEASKCEKSWHEAGKVPGLQIWRIEQFKVVSVPRNTYGLFYSGDSYIVLHTYKKRPDSDALAWNVHFWLGLNTTQDEAGTAAYKTVELDDFLGGAPVEFREVQDNESPLFLSYFNPGIRILEGGVQTGFRHVGPANYQPRLLQLKGKKNVRLRQVPLDAKSVNSGDVFVLDLGLTLVQFNGKQSNPLERAKAAEICRTIDTERDGKPQVVVFEERDAKYPEEWSKLLGSGPYNDAKTGGDDNAFEKAPSQKLLFRLSDASGQLVMTKVAEAAAVKRGLLDTNDVFILDIGRQVFAWIGHKASVEERSKGIRYAEMYLKEHNLPAATPISRVVEGGENDYFWSSFA
jgi:gelsolin